MNIRSFAFLATTSALLSTPSHAQTVTFFDDFEDNIITGWTFPPRNGTVEIANPNWVEANGRLEQLTDNYDFPIASQGSPTLGTIALAPAQVNGDYEISTFFTNLEPGNNFQDQSFVFGYTDENNFSILQTNMGGSISFFQVVDGGRDTIISFPDSITFNDESTLVTLRHNSTTGSVTVTYGDDTPVEHTDPAFIIAGDHSVGVGSNNDAFTINDFTITSGFPATDESRLEITSLVLNPDTGAASVTWTSELGIEYFLDRSTDLINWEEINDTSGAAGTTTLDDVAPGASKVFYRVRSGV